MEYHYDGEIRLVKLGPLGPYENNIYAIVDPETNESIVFDAPAEGEVVLERLRGTTVQAIALSHTHEDHTPALRALREATGARVYCHADEPWIEKSEVDVALRGGEEIAVGHLRVQAIHTPGHTPGSVCYRVGKHLISGDTLFPGGPGWSATPENLREEIRSITERLFVLPDETRVYPGHGEDTTIGAAKAEYAVFAARQHPPDLCGDVLWLES